jgi:hypothetical protein
VGVLHRNGLAVELELDHKPPNLCRIIVGHQEVASGALQKAEQSSMVYLGIPVQPSSGHGVWRINKKDDILSLQVFLNTLQAVPLLESDPIPNPGDIQNAAP